MKSLASVSAITGVQVDELANTLSRMAETGHVGGRELKQLGGPVLEQLAKNLGVGQYQLRQLAEAGTIGPKDVLKALGDVTQEGGKLAGALEARAHTLAGAWDIAGEQLKSIAGSLGVNLIGGFREGFGGSLKGFIEWTASIKDGIVQMRPFFVQIGAWASYAADTTRLVFGLAWDGVKAGWEWLKSTGTALWDDIGNAIGRLEPFFDRLKAWAVGFAFVASGAIGWVTDGFKSLGAIGSGSLTDLINRNADWIIGITAGVLGVYALSTAFSVLKVSQILSAAMWLGWIGVVGIAKLAMLLFSAVVVGFNVGMAIMGGVLAFASGGFAGLATFVLGAKVATWLFNSALTVTNALLLGAGLIGAAVVIGGIGLAFKAAWEMAKGFGGAMGSVVGIFGSFSSGNGPMGTITSLFGQWKSIVGDIFELMKTDMPGAMAVAKAAFALAVAQIGELFPPLWAYLKEGFLILFDTVAQNMEVTFKKTWLELHSDAFSPFATKHTKDMQQQYRNALGLLETNYKRLQDTRAEHLKFNAPVLTVPEASKDIVQDYALNHPDRTNDVQPFGMSDDVWSSTLNLWRTQANVKFQGVLRKWNGNFLGPLFGQEGLSPAAQVKNYGDAVKDQTQMAKAPQLVGAYQQGSVGAADLIAKFQAENQLSGQDTILAKVDRTNDLLQRNNDAVQAVERAVEKIQRPSVFSW